ncbi:hypothetical protein NP493_182g03037 [Ridgeia piscesae]|uniref:Uncharacterized protein n=1 Tax=Ridgeia piscesae TaxID=27915 RepID=A0AAD9P2D9_RIDPI|nr:hypothetical protein NP493_182g03037 [Ridgeia piscesae]
MNEWRHLFVVQRCADSVADATTRSTQHSMDACAHTRVQLEIPTRPSVCLSGRRGQHSHLENILFTSVDDCHRRLRPTAADDETVRLVAVAMTSRLVLILVHYDVDELSLHSAGCSH